ncbi:ATP-binding protein [Pantoea ananatis]|uniref:ATP-binding protein n=1 Tax=Pantoea ananas TaxID=553 RepID=UPI00188E1955|nr:ATP-binding protein [Pantoea ananatis]
MSRQYEMKISRMTVDKLGVKLYDRAYAVIAELVSNSYDADATNVVIKAPMGQFLAYKQDGQVTSKNVTIEVEDDGVGMAPEELQNFYLIVGAERRKDPKRGELSKKFGRKVMGRKGVGKLAPFGVCKKVEIISAGGDIINNGVNSGYEVAHIILDKEKIMDDTASSYLPVTGELDGTLSEKTYTRIILSDFEYRKISEIKELSRQLSQRFGVKSRNWSVTLYDTSKTPSSPEYMMSVGAFNVAVMPNSKIEFKSQSGTTETSSIKDLNDYVCLGPDGTVLPDFFAGFNYEGKSYPVLGWIAYAREPYKDELMAGVRIYCRGKFAAQTSLFNRKAGFTGEHSIRSYLVGELHADWLDEKEDLIQTDRRDILWSDELGAEFQKWGQSIVLHVGKITRNPLRENMMQQFFDLADVENQVKKAYPGKNQGDLRTQATKVAKLLGKSLRGDELTDPDALDNMVQLSILLAPLQSLDDKLNEAAAHDDTPLSVLNDILATAQLAETVSFGQKVKKRLKIISRLEALKDLTNTPEDELQELISAAPWLVNPQWVPVTSNKSLATLKTEFMKYYEKKYGIPINLNDFTKSSKRPDFVLFSQDGKLQIIEIKKPHHKIANTEMDRIINYIDAFAAFLEDETHEDFRQIASDFHVTLVSDGENLSGAQKKAYTAYIAEKRLTPVDWAGFLLRTTKTHQEFLDEAEQLKVNGNDRT